MLKKVLVWQVNIWATHRPIVLSSSSVCSFVTERQSTNFKCNFLEFLDLSESTFKAPHVFSGKNALQYHSFPFHGIS